MSLNYTTRFELRRLIRLETVDSHVYIFIHKRMVAKHIYIYIVCVRV